MKFVEYEPEIVFSLGGLGHGFVGERPHDDARVVLVSGNQVFHGRVVQIPGLRQHVP